MFILFKFLGNIAKNAYLELSLVINGTVRRNNKLLCSVLDHLRIYTEIYRVADSVSTLSLFEPVENMKKSMIFVFALLAIVSGFVPIKEQGVENEISPLEFEKFINSTAKPIRGTRILGGATASSSQFPYQAAVFIVDTVIKRCAGTIIAKNYVLTVAHCVQK